MGLLPLKPEGENSSLPLLSFWRWPSILGIAWLAAASLQFLSLSSHGILSVSLSSHDVCLFLHEYQSYWIRFHPDNFILT